MNIFKVNYNSQFAMVARYWLHQQKRSLEVNHSMENTIRLRIWQNCADQPIPSNFSLMPSQKKNNHNQFLLIIQQNVSVFGPTNRHSQH